MSTAPPAVAALACTLRASDGRGLAAVWHRPAAAAVHAVAVVSPAGGVPQQRYSGFAQWLAGRGYAVLTYDHRGIGRSRAGPLRQELATMQDWARLDMGAALAEATGMAAGTSAQSRLPLLWVGHSFGGNAVAFAPGAQAVDAFLLVAAGLGELRLVPWPQRWALLLAQGLWLPALVRVYGYLPGRALGAGALPLPAGVVRDYLRWSGLRGWIFGEPALQPHDGAAAFDAPLHLWSVDDDRLHASRASVDALAARFAQRLVQRHHLRPQALGLPRLGHFGAFGRRAGPALWQQLLQPLEAAVPALQPRADRAPAGAVAPSSGSAAAQAGRYSAPP